MVDKKVPGKCFVVFLQMDWLWNRNLIFSEAKWEEEVSNEVFRA